MDTFSRHYAIALQLLRLPVARLCFQLHIDPRDIAETYRYYTKPHPRYKLIKHKTIGAALLDLNCFASREHYLEQISARNWGGHHAKRARARGYAFAEIERNRHVDDIHAINTSIEQRQGRPMDQHYLEKKLRFDDLAHFRYYGILNPQGKLMAYANVGLYGNFGAFSELLGYRNNDGIMHLLIVEIVCQLIDRGQLRYVMYDTFFGANPGLQSFKKILGFQPYRAKYSLQ